MSIIAYTGLPRSGKSYEVTTGPIYTALKEGRRVVSNIAGLNFEAMRDELLVEGVPIDKIGTIVPVSLKDIEKPTFWRTEEDAAAGLDAFIQPGDFLAFDEVWRFWRRRGMIEPRAESFLRMHGHFPHPVSGRTCDVALITQKVGDINEVVRGLIDETFVMKKLTAFGMPKAYSVFIYQLASTRKADLIRTYQTKYNPKYFGFYKSHSQNTSGVSAVEKTIDDRGNILKRKVFVIGVPLAVIGMIFGSFYIYSYFHPSPKTVEAKAGDAKDKDGNPVPPKPTSRPQDGTSERWRVVGFYTSQSRTAFVLRDDAANKTRYLYSPASAALLGGLSIDVKLPEGGDLATTYSGSSRAPAVPGAASNMLPDRRP